MKKTALWTCFVMLFLLISCRKETPLVKAPAEYIQSQKSKLAPVTLTHDISYLPTQEIQVLKLLVKASQSIDEAFLIQVNEDNLNIRALLKNSTDSLSAEYLDFFNIMFGPWNRLDEDRPFINQKQKPAGANYYPAGLTKQEWNAWLEKHPEDKEEFENNFTMIRRQDNMLVAIPYSEFFRDQIRPMVKLLEQAANLTSDPTLATFLLSRAEGFLKNDYYQSDMDWMDLNGDIEVVIGPYEVYEDNLFGYKAAFESFVCVVDHQESKKLREIAGKLTEMEDMLPIPREFKNFERGSDSPIKVVHLLYSAGDTKAGIQTTAFNLPNDERVREAKGSKKVMLKNVMKAKYDKCWTPIVSRVLAPSSLENVSFEGYFYHVLLHEVSHGLGPGIITVNNEKTTVNKQLKELYSVIEECKADVVGIYLVQYLIDQHILPESLEQTLYASYLGGMFRSIRFGIEAAHGGGVAIQLNHYLDAGACTVDKNGKFEVNDRKMKPAIRDLAQKLLLIQARGDYEAARVLIGELRSVRPEVQAALDLLTDVPIDIKPVYPIENEI
ncbi:peptidase [bacterium]|nr:peptidase [bacterium]